MDEKNRAYAEKMIQGDEPAFDELYRSYSGKLYRMAYVITGNKSDSEDVLQETFVKCYLHRKELKDASRFESWLYRILVRTAWKAARGRRELSLESILEDPDQGKQAIQISRDQSAGPLERFIDRETSGELLSLVGKLDVKYRTVVVLHYYNELSTREIARITGTLEGTVKSRLYKARKLLRKQMEGNGEKERGMRYEEKLG